MVAAAPFLFVAALGINLSTKHVQTVADVQHSVAVDAVVARIAAAGGIHPAFVIRLLSQQIVEVQCYSQWLALQERLRNLLETGAVYSWSALNPDSTALSLAFLSEYGDATAAAIKYNALVENFKSTTTAGAFTYYGDDSIYSSRDALTGLAAYLLYGNLVDATVDTNTETETATANTAEASQVAANQDTVSTSETSASDVKAADNSMANVFVILMAASAVLLVVTAKKNAVK